MIGRSVIVPFRWIFLALLSALIGALPFADATRAAEPQVPVLWDAKERLPKPDLSALPRLRFLTTTDFPPFNFLDGSGRLSGFHIDLARAICAELGIVEKCQIQALPWNDLDDALRKGEGEAIIAGIAATPESREKYAFSRSYLQFPARFIMPKAKAFTEPILDKLRSKRVGVIAGSAHEKMLRDYFSTVQVVPFDKPEDLYADLKAGRIDAAFGDGMRFAFWLGGSEAAGCCRFAGGPYLAPEYLGSGMAIATRAGDPALAAAFDYALQEISIKGTFAEFYLRYFPVSFF
ncbi:amino acid ABC transporter [Mesorhizobium sp. WSM3866]|uniref:transporter substrate-binding domain-containing protein n=1 Tax=unclassified Mesorhizobium TaxID=325217 RepID=UPI000BAF9F21|nr:MULTISPECIES: transporter substrate-binding domain-containing protein [unclassified Mesorhizobium]MDG4854007.1 transporter substrate-binding domain-containing protein [Mesorhizobium sp. WSM4982]MDG4899910.1 transporter substrate-binding domain-containing protein [Mesorhizobium sp. WSM4962]MDG4905834.1 transporter substrate-binding domain-containing protein [Mesorhizobium sp. WSM4898]MDG4914726.1 transporter substrate-binding domain-containing protein [Mesorhizobium sp. WSM4983]MDG4917855.1 